MHEYEMFYISGQFSHSLWYLVCGRGGREGTARVNRGKQESRTGNGRLTL